MAGAQSGTKSARGAERARQRPTSMVSQMERLAFADVEPNVEHNCDLVGKVQTCNVLANRNMLITIEVPMAYAHEALDVAIESKTTFTYLRIYQVPHHVFVPHETAQAPVVRFDDGAVVTPDSAA